MKVLEQLDSIIIDLDYNYSTNMQYMINNLIDIKGEVHSIIIKNERLDGALQTLEANALKQIDILQSKIQQLELIIKAYKESE